MPSPVRFAEVRKLMEKHGWTLQRIRGSHHTFVKPGQRCFPVPVHDGKVDYAYYRKIQKDLLGGD
jgi:predicted RNA binding protein YcfA (HicA-like mRNA interferase family)